MKVLIVDDERLAREELKRLLADYPGIHVIGEAANGHDAIGAIRRLDPDAVFLDVQMPGLSGFEVVEALDPPLPWIVFVTAYDKHAIQAFEVNALDFILKPADPARLRTSIERLLERAGEPRPDAVAPGARLAESDRIFLRDGDRCWFVPVSEVKLLESEGNHTRVHFNGGAAIIGRSLSELEGRLPERLFFRANRAQVINTVMIEEIVPWFSGGFKARLAGGLEFEFSRRAARQFREQRSL